MTRGLIVINSDSCEIKNLTCDLTGDKTICQTFEIDRCNVVACQTLGNLTEFFVCNLCVKLFNCSVFLPMECGVIELLLGLTVKNQ